MFKVGFIVLFAGLCSTLLCPVVERLCVLKYPLAVRTLLLSEPSKSEGSLYDPGPGVTDFLRLETVLVLFPKQTTFDDGTVDTK